NHAPARLEPSDLHARQINREPSPAVGSRRNKRWQEGVIMRAQTRLWLDYDLGSYLGSLTVPTIGVSAIHCLRCAVAEFRVSSCILRKRMRAVPWQALLARSYVSRPAKSSLRRRCGRPVSPAATGL